MSTERSRRLHQMNSRTRRRKVAHLVREQANLCALCHGPFTAERPATLDHVHTATMPLVSKDRQSYQAAHRDCNELRGDKPMDVFLLEVAQGRIKLPE